MSSDWQTTRRRHGTQSGWALHQQLNETPCDACYRAKQEYDKRYKSAPDKARKARLHAKAQNKALGELSRMYPEEYKAFYAKWKQRLLEEAASSVNSCASPAISPRPSEI